MLNSCSENKTLISCPDGATQNQKTMDKEKQILFEKWYTTFRTRSGYVKKTFSEFTISEKEDYLISNYSELVPASSTKINAVTKLTASQNVPFDIITKVDKSKGILFAEGFRYFGKQRG